jgi:hypothetical protein
MASQDMNAAAAEREHLGALSEWRADKANRKNKSDAAEKGLQEFIAEAMKNPNTKKNLGSEGLSSMKDGQAGHNAVRDAVKKSNERFGGEITEEDFTGINQDMPWLRD